MEQKVVAACLENRGSWEKVIYYDLSKDFSPLCQALFIEISAYYNRDSKCLACDSEVILGLMSQKYPKRKEEFSLAIDSLPRVSATNILNYVLGAKKEHIKDRIQLAITGRDDSDLESQLLAYQSLQSQDSGEEDYEVYKGDSLSDIVDNYQSGNRIKVLPTSLNAKLNGGIPKNTSCNILIFAAVEVGKSLFSINMTYGFCAQGLSVMYIGNEEDHSKLRFRFTSRFASVKKKAYTEKDILQDYRAAHKAALARNFNNLSFVPLSPGSVRDLPILFKKLKPDVIVIDQMRKITYPRADKEAEQITSVSKYIRDFGKENHIITVNVCQANAKKSGGAYIGLVLRKSDIYMSNVTVPGDMDLMIGIGSNDEYESKNWRKISIPKNKISGWHGSFDVKIDPSISKVMSFK